MTIYSWKTYENRLIDGLKINEPFIELSLFEQKNIAVIRKDGKITLLSGFGAIHFIYYRIHLTMPDLSS